MIVADEFGLVKDKRSVEMLKSNLRAHEEIPLRVVYTANPGGPLHAIHPPAFHFLCPRLGTVRDRWRVLSSTAPPRTSTTRTLGRTIYLRRLKPAAAMTKSCFLGMGHLWGLEYREGVHSSAARWTKGSTCLPVELALHGGQELANRSSHSIGVQARPVVTYVCPQSAGATSDLSGERQPDPVGRARHRQSRTIPNSRPRLETWKMAEANSGNVRGSGVSCHYGVGDDADGPGKTRCWKCSAVIMVFISVRPRVKQRVIAVIGRFPSSASYNATAPQEGRPGMYISARCRLLLG